MIPNAAVAHHLVSEYDEAKVVDIFHIVLLNIDPVLEDMGTEDAVFYENMYYDKLWYEKRDGFAVLRLYKYIVAYVNLQSKKWLPIR